MNKRTIKTKKKMQYKVTARDMEKPRYFSDKMKAERFAARHDANGYGYPAWVEVVAR